MVESGSKLSRAPLTVTPIFPLQKQRRQEQKELRQRQRREYRQTMKEKRSGLFKKEEVVSLSNGQPSETGEEEEDIDILT